METVRTHVLSGHGQDRLLRKISVRRAFVSKPAMTIAHMLSSMLVKENARIIYSDHFCLTNVFELDFYSNDVKTTARHTHRDDDSVEHEKNGIFRKQIMLARFLLRQFDSFLFSAAAFGSIEMTRVHAMFNYVYGIRESFDSIWVMGCAKNLNGM